MEKELLEPLEILPSQNNLNWSERAQNAAINYLSAFNNGKQQFSNIELARERAAFTRWKSIENLDQYLIEFESNFIREGGKVIWAQDISDALMSIEDILNKNGSKLILKSKTSTGDEIGITESLTNEGYKLIANDTGDFIVNESDSMPSHMILPSIHKSFGEIKNEFSALLGLNNESTIEEIVEKIRVHLRASFSNVDVGITGCNYLLADPGAIVVMENEGNVQLTASMPKVHIVLAGIDKILPSINDLDLFLPLTSTFATGQTIANYNNIISGPKRADDVDGPDEMYVILLDNGRSNVLKHEVQRQALTCIKCGACQYFSPIYHSSSPSSTNSPFHAIVSPLLKDELTADLPSIAGPNQDVCPVKIDMQKLLLQNRKLFVDEGLNHRSEKLFYFIWKKAMLKRDIMNWKGIKAGKYIMENLNRSKNQIRTMPHIADKSFNEQWREKMNFK